jgi:ArsR family transcriptional regulator, arsenate/arsenite/antimonite-responsive transcriptional repressor
LLLRAHGAKVPMMNKLASIAAALGDPLRLQILELLAAGRSKPCCSPENPDAPVWVCACDLSERLGGLAHSKLAYHLNLLRTAGLLQEQQRGKWVYYAIDEEALGSFTQALSSRLTRQTKSCCFGSKKKRQNA